MKRILWTLAAVALCCCLFGCMSGGQRDQFDASQEGIVEIETRTAYPVDEESVKLKSYVIADQKRIMPVETVTKDEMAVFFVPYNCFASYIDRSQNKVLNSLKHIALTDAAGNKMDVPPVIAEMFPEIAKLEHDLCTVQIFQIENEYFVYVELNVNLWDPCSLYYYNQEKKLLIQLCTFNNEYVQGIHILSLERLHPLHN